MPPRSDHETSLPSSVGESLHPPCLFVPPKDGAAAKEDSSNKDKASKKNEEEKYPFHNTSSNTGWRRTTFHWEINLVTFPFFFALLYGMMRSHRPWLAFTAHTLLLLVLFDATRYYYHKGRTPGTPYTLPIVNILAMLVFPVRYWAELGTIAMAESNTSSGLCTSKMAQKFMLFVTDPALCRQVMTGEGTFQIYAHPNALWLFGPKNLIYMPTIEHKAFRAILTPALFSADALQQYAQAQERVARLYLSKVAPDETGSVLDARVFFRSLAAASSQEAFLGPYLTDALRQQLEQDILTFTLGFLSFPCPWFGGLRQAILAKDRIEHAIMAMVPQARQYMLLSTDQPKNAPRCLLDRWVVAIHEATRTGGPGVAYCDDANIARTVLDFLFAAQDATNSALTFALDVLDAHRDIWQQVGQDTDGAFTARVANQLLHHKPPVPMIPHMALRDCELGGRRIPRGSIVIPSITYSSRVSGAAREFMAPQNDTDALFVRTVVFGAGQHKCPGRRYAESLLVVVLRVLARDYAMERAVFPRPTVDEFVYYPTLFPKECSFRIYKKTKTTTE